MCGIAGIIGTRDQGLLENLPRMGEAFPHRGPDDKGHFIDRQEGVGFAHRRLSIIDTSKAGAQPMKSGDENLVIVFNGEIYNYIEIRKTLEDKGHSFQTRTDTEVILEAYKQWGADCLKYFNGMWAFALFDKKNRKVFMARDRLGIKPFYYFQNSSGVFYFASEIKAILAVLETNPDCSEELIDSYMSFGYVPGENTMLKGMKRLLPGFSLTLSLNNQSDLSINKYWDLNYSQTKDIGLDYFVDKGKTLLNDAIDLRLRSDVPLGIFLSGGLDSSAVVGLLAPRVKEKLKTFSVAYDFGKNFNETPYARQIATQFNTDHHEFFVTQKEFKDFIPDFVRYMDEPVTEAAAISLYFIAKLAKEHVTVVLSGEGSDEIFAGYDFYRYMRHIETYRSVVGKDLAQMIKMCGSAVLPAGNKIRKYLELAGLPLDKRYKGISTYEEGMKSQLYRKDFQEQIDKRQLLETGQFIDSLFCHTKGCESLSRMLYFDTKTWLVDDLLIKADRMSMAASLELRVPFLDYRLVEFAAALPSKYKIRKGQNKFLLKQMMKGILPDTIINRKKMGFPTPLKLMFQNELAGYARDVLASGSCIIHKYFNKKAIKQLLQEHISGNTDHHRVIWQLLVLEEWMQGWQKS